MTPIQEHIAYLNRLHEIIVAYYGSESVKKIQLDVLSLCISNAKKMRKRELQEDKDRYKYLGGWHETNEDNSFNTKEK
jgi:hypothetical protein